MANPAHVAVVKQLAKAIAQWRGAHLSLGLDLTDAVRAGAGRAGADLADAMLAVARLCGRLHHSGDAER